MEEGVFMPSSRINNLFYKYNKFPKAMVEKEHTNNMNLSLAKSIRIPFMLKLPPYISWIHVSMGN